MAKYNPGDLRADLLTWVSNVNDTMTTGVQNSVLGVVESVRVPVESGGAMPVKRGNLRNSLQAEIGGMPGSNYEVSHDETLPDPMPQIETVVSHMIWGDRIGLGFRANYAAAQNRVYQFIDLTAQKWAQIADSAFVKAKGRP